MQRKKKERKGKRRGRESGHRWITILSFLALATHTSAPWGWQKRMWKPMTNFSPSRTTSIISENGFNSSSQFFSRWTPTNFSWDFFVSPIFGWTMPKNGWSTSGDTEQRILNGSSDFFSHRRSSLFFSLFQVQESRSGEQSHDVSNRWSRLLSSTSTSDER